MSTSHESSGPTERSEVPDYDALHATVVRALDADDGGTDAAAHEVLDRLRDRGLPIPPRTADNADMDP